MAKLAGVLVAVVLVAGACGGSGGTSALQTVQASAGKTTAASTVELSATIKSDTGVFAKGLSYTGGFDFAAHRGRLQFDPAALAIPSVSGKFEAIFDSSAGLVIYVHFPALASQLGGKSWVKIDAGALGSKASGVDLNSLLQGQSSDPTSGLRLLAGATQVTKVGSESVRGTPTTHFHVIIDIDKAAAAAPAQSRDAMRKLADRYTVKTFPVDAWLDSSNRVRRSVVVIDTANLKLPASAGTPTGKFTVTTELFNFGAPVDAALPPANQVADFSQLAGGGQSSVSSGQVSAAKAAYIAKANAICQTMVDKTSALPDPGTDPVAKANVDQQGSAITATALRQLRALPTPPGDAAKIRAIYAKIDVLLSDVSAEIAALRAGNQAQAQTLEARINDDTAASNAASNAYGLTVCGS
jgi:hypothetical protein